MVYKALHDLVLASLFNLQWLCCVAQGIFFFPSYKQHFCLRAFLCLISSCLGSNVTSAEGPPLSYLYKLILPPITLQHITLCVCVCVYITYFWSYPISFFIHLLLAHMSVSPLFSSDKNSMWHIISPHSVLWMNEWKPLLQSTSLSFLPPPSLYQKCPLLQSMDFIWKVIGRLPQIFAEWMKLKWITPTKNPSLSMLSYSQKY